MQTRTFRYALVVTALGGGLFARACSLDPQPEPPGGTVSLGPPYNTGGASNAGGAGGSEDTGFGDASAPVDGPELPTSAADASVDAKTSDGAAVRADGGADAGAIEDGEAGAAGDTKGAEVDVPAE
jgi:hypothetical protein